MAEWQTRCLQAAVTFDRAGSTPANRTIFTMDATLIETLKQWNITTVLPLSVGDFQLLEEYRMIEKDGKPVEYRLFTYENEENGWTVRAIFNPESGRICYPDGHRHAGVRPHRIYYGFL